MEDQVVLKNLEDNSKVMGYPAKSIKDFFKELGVYRMIDNNLPSIDKKTIEGFTTS